MARVETVLVSSTKAYEATGPDGAMVTVKNLGPDSCVFAAASTVSSGSNDGTLTSGSSMAFTPSKFFLSSGTSSLQVTTAVGDQFRQYDKDNKQPGMYVPSAPGWNTTNTAPTASRATFARFVPSRNMTINSIAFHVITLGADVACDVGIYSADLQTRLGVSTAATGRLASIGVKNISLTSPVTLTAGVVYYAAFSSDAGSTAVLTFAVYNGAATASLFGTAAGTVELDFKAASHPLPTTLTVTGGLGGVPLLAVRES